jgi:Tol biopolymer transport system component/DNA-binding winged helix-turn-helix (wHTH) protein
MPLQPGELYEFGGFRLDPAECVLRRDGQSVALPPKAFDLLVVLVERAGRLVTKEDLLKDVWLGTFVEEANLSYTVSLLRKALSEDGETNRFIETVPKKGYRFTETVRIVKVVPDVVGYPGSTSRGRWWLVPAAAIGLIVLAAGYGGYRQWANRMLGDTRQQVDPATTPPTMTQLTYDSGLTTQPALSRDGRLLAYASDRGGGGNLEIWMQRMDGTAPVQLTHSSVTNHEPSFSPDGSRIVFESGANGGGIYVIPANTGGHETLLVRGGHNPRYSPDGRHIAYWMGGGGMGGDTAAAGSNGVFIVPAEGGRPLAIAPDFVSALWPVWSPDSQHLLIAASADPLAPLQWYVVPVQGGRPVDTRLRLPERYQFPHLLQPEVWRADRIVFSTYRRGPSSLWETHIAPETWRVSDSAKPLTSGTEHYASASASDDGQIVFSSTIRKNQVWSVPVAGELGRVLGDPERITEGVHPDMQVALSADGRIACYVRSNSAGGLSMYVKDFITGAETLRRGPGVQVPTISADGSRIAYRTWEAKKARIEVVRTSGGAPEQLSLKCEACLVGDWSHQNDRLLYYGSDDAPGQIFVMDLPTGRTTRVAGGAGHNLYEPRFSPDDHWLSFLETSAGKTRVWIAPMRNRVEAADPGQWIAVTDGEAWDDKPRWSPGGSMIYYTSDRDGFVCVWGRRLDPVTRLPLGAPFAVKHFHAARLSMVDLRLDVLSLGVARDRLVLILGEHTGNIWKMPLDPER